MLLLKKGDFDGMDMEAGKSSFIWREQLAAGDMIYLLGSQNEGICECGEKLWDCGGEGSRRYKRIDRT